jgi:hypothetical protein
MHQEQSLPMTPTLERDRGERVQGRQVRLPDIGHVAA